MSALRITKRRKEGALGASAKDFEGQKKKKKTSSQFRQSHDIQRPNSLMQITQLTFTLLNEGNAQTRTHTHREAVLRIGFYASISVQCQQF